MDEDSSSHPDQEVARVLASKSGPQNMTNCIMDESLSADPRPSTVLTNLSRGNTATMTPSLQGHMSIHQLAGQGELEALKQNLENSHPDLVDSSGFTPLFWATAYNQLNTAQYLVDNGANPVHRSISGETALAIAASRGNEGMVRFLLRECGCDVNTVDDFANSPLLYAVAENHLGCVRLLLEGGANFSHRNLKNLSAFDIALSHKHFDIQRELEKYMLRLLERHT